MTQLIFSLMESDGICRNPPNPETEVSDASLQKNARIENIFKMGCPLNLWIFLIQNRVSSIVFLSIGISRSYDFEEE